MQYKSELYGKIGNSYIPLEMSSEDVDKIIIINKLLEKEINDAYAYLSFQGVPKERAKTLVNGIDVLITRMIKERDSLCYQIDLLKNELEIIKKEYIND